MKSILMPLTVTPPSSAMVNVRIHFSGDSASLLDNQKVRKAYLGLH